MKRYLAVGLILVITLIATNSYAARVIELTKFRIENIQIYKQSVNIGTEEEPVMERRWSLAINYTLTNDTGNTLGDTKIFMLDVTQRTQIKNYLKQFIDVIKDEEGLTEIE